LNNSCAAIGRGGNFAFIFTADMIIDAVEQHIKRKRHNAVQHKTEGLKHHPAVAN